MRKWRKTQFQVQFRPLSFFCEFYLSWMLDIVASNHCMQFQGKLMNQTWENGKKPNFEPNFDWFDPNLCPNFFLWVLHLLNVRHCCKLPLYAIWRKTNYPNSRWLQKNSFWARFRPVGPKFGLISIFFKNLRSSVTRYCQLSSCTISEKTNDRTLRKLSDGRTDRRTSDFIGSCPANVARIVSFDEISTLSTNKSH